MATKDPTVVRLMSLLQTVLDSGMSFVEYVKVKRQELEDLQDELQELENLSKTSDNLALTTSTGRARRKDAGKPRQKPAAETEATEPAPEPSAAAVLAEARQRHDAAVEDLPSLA